MTRRGALLGLLAETPVHAGAGQVVGAIDLPIQREAHTGWPCIYGSAVKGALRAKAEELSAALEPDDERDTNSGAEGAEGPAVDWVSEVFGPDVDRSSEHAGALAVSDARVALLPVRSLTGHFKWVTCPAALRRLRDDAARAGIQVGYAVPDVGVENDEGPVAMIPDGSGPEGTLFLEELLFRRQPAGLGGVVEALARLMGRADAAEALSNQLAVVSDDRFAHLAVFATPVATHVRIDNRSKTVERGALWVEESLPPETLLYVSVLARASRRPREERGGPDAPGVLAYAVRELFPETDPYLRLGGNETVGMGWCRARAWVDDSEGGS